MSEEAVCQTCGIRGFPEALNYCMTCGEAAEHTQVVPIGKLVIFSPAGIRVFMLHS